MLTSIAVTPGSSRLVVGAVQQFAATGSYSDGSVLDITSSVTWTSSNATVAGLATGGSATANGAGSAVVTASSGSVSGSAALDVTSEYLLVTQLAGNGVYKIDPFSGRIVSRLGFSANPGRPAADTGRRVAYLPLNDQILALRPDTMETSVVTVPGLGKNGTFAALDPLGKTLAIVNHGADGLRSPDDRLDIVTLDPDVWPPSATLNFSIVVGQQPIRTLIDHAGRYALVSVRDDAKILAIDIAGGSIASQFVLPAGSEPEGMDLHPTKNIAYVTLHGTNQIEIIDLDANPPQLTGSVAIKSAKGLPQPSGGSFTPDGSRFYVSGQTTNEVLCFDSTNPAAPVQDAAVSLPTAPQPHGIAYFSDGRAYVANTNNTQPHGSFSVIQDYQGTPAVTGQVLVDVILNPLYHAVFP